MTGQFPWQMHAKETRRRSCIAINAGSRILHAKNKLIYLRFRLPPILLKHYYNHARLLCEAEQKRLSAMPTKSEAQTNDRMWFGPATSDVCLGTILVSKFEKCSENRAVWCQGKRREWTFFFRASPKQESSCWKRPIHQSLTTSEPPTLLFAG
jgi:hypothetical protein